MLLMQELIKLKPPGGFTNLFLHSQSLDFMATLVFLFAILPELTYQKAQKILCDNSVTRHSLKSLWKNLVNVLKSL